MRFPALSIDRFLTIHFFSLLAPFRAPKGIRIPILMYHSISSLPEKGYPYYWLNTSPKIFKEQMKILAENQYRAVSVSKAAEIIGSKEGQFIPPLKDPRERLVVITFDDGYQDFEIEAFPILKECKFSATVFLPVGFISKERSNFKNKRCLSWDRIRELSKLGVDFGSHTMTHPNLRDLQWGQVEREIITSKGIIEENLGKRVESFSYPYAFPDEDRGLKSKLRRLLTKSGYTSGVTTIIGTTTIGDDLFFMKRIPISSQDDSAFFQAKLEGRYDWVRGIQYGFKWLKKTIK